MFHVNVFFKKYKYFNLNVFYLSLFSNFIFTFLKGFIVGSTTYVPFPPPISPF